MMCSLPLPCVCAAHCAVGSVWVDGQPVLLPALSTSPVCLSWVRQPVTWQHASPWLRALSPVLWLATEVALIGGSTANSSARRASRLRAEAGLLPLLVNLLLVWIYVLVTQLSICLLRFCMFAQCSCAKNHLDDKLLSGGACKSFLRCSCDFFAV